MSILQEPVLAPANEKVECEIENMDRKPLYQQVENRAYLFLSIADKLDDHDPNNKETMYELKLGKKVLMEMRESFGRDCEDIPENIKKVRDIIKIAREYVEKNSKNPQEAMITQLSLEKAIYKEYVNNLYNSTHTYISPQEVLEIFNTGDLTKFVESADTKTIGVDDLFHAINTNDSPLKAIQNFILNPNRKSFSKDYFPKAMEVFGNEDISDDIKAALAIKITYHSDFLHGDNSLLKIYQHFSTSSFFSDPKVQMAYKIYFLELDAKHQERLSQGTPKTVPHLETAEEISHDIDLIIHPFYWLSNKILHNHDHNNNETNDNRSPVKINRRFVEDYTLSLVQQENELGRLVPDSEVDIKEEDLVLFALACSIELLEEYNQVFNHSNQDKTMIFVLPKFTNRYNDALTFQQVTAQILDSSSPENAYYVESQTDGAGYLFPQDIKKILGNHQRELLVSGESVGRCVSNTISDLPSEMIKGTKGLSIDPRELSDLIESNIDFKNLLQKIHNKMEEQQIKSFSELQDFYKDNIDLFEQYHLFVEKKFKKTLNY